MDNYSPIPFIMSFAQDVLARYETWAIFQPFKNYVREYGLKFCLEYMAAEDLQTNFIDIGPVNKVLNFISAYHGKFSPFAIVCIHIHSIFVAHFIVHL